MSLAALIRNMSAAGAPAEAIALAVEAIEAAEAKINESKAKARDRKRAERERARQSRDSHATVTDEPLSPAPSFPPDPHTNPTPIPAKSITRARKAWACPEGVNPDHWRDFLACRKTKKLTCSDTAYEGQLRRLAELSDNEWPPGRLVQHAAEHGWASIHDPRGTENGRFRQPNSQQRMAGHRPSAALALIASADADDRTEGFPGDQADYWGTGPQVSGASGY